MDVPLVDLALQHEGVFEEIAPRLRALVEESRFVGGAPVEEFERAFAAYERAAFCAGVANGTDALEFLYRALGIGVGDEVIVPANSFAATAEAVARTGARTVFVDCDDDCLLIDPSQLERAISPRTRAVVPVHLYGQMAPLEAIEAVVAGTDIAIIEDAAQAHGASRFGRTPATNTVGAGFSFYPGKNLGAWGDAGAVVANDGAIIEKIRLFGNHGAQQQYGHVQLGFTSRLDTLQAVVLSAKLKRLEDGNNDRRKAARRYDELLDGVDGVRIPAVMEGNEPVWHLYVIRVDRRDDVLGRLRAGGVAAQVHYPVPIHLQPAFASADNAPCPVAERTAGQLLSLPIYPGITADQQEYVVEVLRAAIS